MSTLHVENLKGLSSGGNANKIIVPSGQTLDASNGFQRYCSCWSFIRYYQRQSITLLA